MGTENEKLEKRKNKKDFSQRKTKEKKRRKNFYSIIEKI